MAVSPLVSRQTPIPVRKPPKTPLATTTVMANSGVENVVKDVSSPAAAKARTAMVNSSFVANIKTPVSLFQKTPQIPLQKAVLLSAGMWRVVESEREREFRLYITMSYSYTAQKTGRIVLDTPSDPRGKINSDETVLEGRAASTPQGYDKS